MPSLSGAIGAGLQGYLSGSIATKEKYRQEEIARSKEDLKNYMDLVKEGWTPIDESRGASEGAVLKIRGHGYLSAPKVDKAAEHAMKLQLLQQKYEMQETISAAREQYQRGAITLAELKQQLAEVQLQAARERGSGKADEKLRTVTTFDADGNPIEVEMAPSEIEAAYRTGKLPKDAIIGKQVEAPSVKAAREQGTKFAYQERLTALDKLIREADDATLPRHIEEWNALQPPTAIEAYIWVKKPWAKDFKGRFRLPVLRLTATGEPVQMTMGMVIAIAARNPLDTVYDVLLRMYAEAQHLEKQKELKAAREQYERERDQKVTR